MRQCKACKHRGKTWEGGDPSCAFGGGAFDGDNWNCATANGIREICYEGQNPMPQGVTYQYCEDMKYAVIRCDEIEGVNALCMVVVWYKSRGGTDLITLIDSDGPRAPTERECLLVIERYGVELEQPNES